MRRDWCGTIHSIKKNSFCKVEDEEFCRRERLGYSVLCVCARARAKGSVCNAVDCLSVCVR